MPSPIDDTSAHSTAADFYSNPEAMIKALGIGAGAPSGLPVPKMTTASAVRQQRAAYTTKIFDDHATLSAILRRHEATIYKRWTKKTRTQRLKILLTAWKDMPATHRPDFAAFRIEPEAQRTSNIRHRDAFLFPHINQEDLTKPKTLPLFLHARAYARPSDFAMSDAESFRFGVITKAIVPHFLNEHVMMFTGRDTPQTYGQLLHWEDHEEAHYWLYKKIGVHPGEGLVLLEIQQRTLDFLIECCKAILHDLQATGLTADQYTVQPAFQPPSEDDQECYSSLITLAMEAPYRVPASLEWRRIESLLAASKSAAEDHIWSLREDPGYFGDCVLEYKEHRQELLKDTRKQAHPVFTYRQENVFWGRVLGNVLTNAYLSLESELHAQAARLIGLKEKHKPSIKQDAALPGEYLDAILMFQHYLNQAVKGPLGSLKHSVAASPSMRRCFVREPATDISSPRILVKQRANHDMEKPVQQLLWLLQMLWEDDEQLFLAGMTKVVDELQRLLQSDAKANEHVSSFLASTIGNLSIICECLRQIDLYQPWSSTFEGDLLDRKQGLMKQFAQKTVPWGATMTSLKAVEAISSYGNPEDGKFKYPIEKRRTRNNIEQLRSAEAHLDTLWHKVDTFTSKVAGFKHLATGRLFAQSRVLRRTPVWTGSEKPKSRQTTHEAESELQELYKPLSELYFDLEYRTKQEAEHSDQPAPKTKQKTKGTASAQLPTQVEPVDVANPPENDEQPTTFPLDNRALRVLRTLFYTPFLTATPGEVSWTDFLHALMSIGFAAEKLTAQSGNSHSRR